MMDRPRRPPDALKPGQEWVWDYPRPPRVEAVAKRIRVELAGIVIADTRTAWRVLETSHPPVYYLPPEDVRLESLMKESGSSFCEWKGTAAYLAVVAGGRVVHRAAWYYPQPNASFSAIKDHIAFYPRLMDGCFVEAEKVRAQPGSFYGGWITSNIIGPFKGEPGTEGW